MLVLSARTSVRADRGLNVRQTVVGKHKKTPHELSLAGVVDDV